MLRIATFAIILPLACTYAAEKPTDGFVDLYNGKDLTGWTTEGNWVPQDDGSLLIAPREGERGWKRFKDYIWTDKTYKNFILDVEYTYPPGGNSGIFFRVKDAANPVNTGIEAQILDSTKKKGAMTHHDHGGIIRTVGASKNMSKKPGEWNRMVITCRGHHLHVNLNGEDIIDIKLDESAMKDRPLEGHIGLQDHGQPHNLRFRNIRIKELAEKENDVKKSKPSEVFDKSFFIDPTDSKLRSMQEYKELTSAFANLESSDPPHEKIKTYVFSVKLKDQFWVDSLHDAQGAAFTRQSRLLNAGHVKPDEVRVQARFLKAD